MKLKFKNVTKLTMVRLDKFHFNQLIKINKDSSLLIGPFTFVGKKGESDGKTKDIESNKEDKTLVIANFDPAFNYCYKIEFNKDKTWEKLSEDQMKAYADYAIEG